MGTEIDWTVQGGHYDLDRVDKGSGWVVAWLDWRPTAKSHVLRRAKPHSYTAGREGRYSDAEALCGLSTEKIGHVAQAVYPDWWGLVQEKDLEAEKQMEGLCRNCLKKLEAMK